VGARNELCFYLVDVFTQERFGGNPLAVVPDADAVDEKTMRRIARELNQSETTFLLRPPDASKADWQLRSFTAAGVEVFGAGHNALGAWWWLAESGSLSLSDERSRFHQLIGNRTLPVEIVSQAGRPLSIGMTQTQPVFGAKVDDGALLARALGLQEKDLEGSMRAQVVSTGAAHLMVPVRNRDALARCRPESDRLGDVLRSVAGQGCYVFTLDAPASHPTAYARFFNPTVGISEDPATGSAAGPLASYLRAQGVLKTEALIVHQGIEMRRPSRIEVRLDDNEVRVFGSAIFAAEGRLQLEDNELRGMRGRSTDAQELDHLVFEVADPIATARFLEELLNLTPVRLEEYQRGLAPFPSARVSEGLVIDLFPPRMWRGRESRNASHVCVAVSYERFQQLESRLQERSIRITRRDEHNFGARGWGHSLYFDTPDGISIEIRHYATSAAALRP
jgi:PhzF family phenazine biosynthesis protein